MMTDNELNELQDPSSWDYENAETRPGMKGGRTVVSVSFTRDDFERVTKHAETLGVKVSALIRDAVLRSISGEGAPETATALYGSTAFQTQVSQVIPMDYTWSSNAAARIEPGTAASGEGVRILQLIH